MAISTAIDQSAVARVLGIKTIFKDLRAGGILFLPQRVAVFAQGSTASTYSTVKQQVTSAIQAATLYGFGSPIHLAVLQLLPINGDGVNTIPVMIYPLEDDASGTVSTGDITPSGTQTVAAAYQVNVNNILSEAFVINAADTVATIITSMTAAINAVLEMPVIAVDATPGSSTVLTVTSKWKGTSANSLILSVVGSTTAGTSFALTQPVGGLINPDVADALAQVGDIWETMILNCLEIADVTTLEKFSVFGEGRYGALTRKPLVTFTGNTGTTVSSATAVSDSRKTDRTNAQLVAPGSQDVPFVVAARQLARIVRVANNNPPQDYGSQAATGLTPGTDGQQWDYLKRDSAIKKGSSSIQVKDGVINVSDTVTFFHPSGDPIPAYRYVCDIVKLQNIIYNINLIFDNPEWDGAPLIPDDQPTVNRTAKKPKSAVAAICAVIDSLGDNAIISDPETAKSTVIAQISATNPKRLDINMTVQLSGNSNIISLDLNFGFYFGATSFVA
jgi:phage tail sheath gpL-like